MIQVGVAFTLLAMAYIYAFADTDEGIFFHLMLRHDIWGSALMLGIFALAALPGQSVAAVRAISLAIARHRWPLAAAIWLLLCLGAIFIYRNHPLSMDEYAASFQAEVFAAGHLAGRVPPELVDWVLPKGFQGHFFVVNPNTGDMASAYWPGYALLLAPFQWFGIPWACNPLMVAATTLLIGRIAHELTGSEEAQGWAMLLAIASPTFLINGISFYSMPAHLLFNLVFAWLLIRPEPKRIVFAGAVGSFALVLHNPFPHLLFALPWLTWLVLRKENGVRNALLLVIGYLPLMLLIGLGWPHVLRELQQGGVVAAAAASATSSGEELPWVVRIVIGLTRPFHLPDAMTLTFRLGGLAKLWLWSAPFLLLLAIRGATLEDRPPLRLMGASLALTLLGYFFVPVSQGHGWGDRYAHSAWGVLPILAAVLLHREWTEGEPDGRLLSITLRGALLSLVLMTGLRVFQVGSFVGEHLAQRPAFPADVPSVVFVRSGYYAMDMVQNDPWLRRYPLVLVSHGQAADAAMAQKLIPGACRYASGIHGWTYATASSPCASPTP